MVLTIEQTDRIASEIESYVTEMNLTRGNNPVHFLPEHQKIKNVGNEFPLVQVKFVTEGNRQRMWQDLLYEGYDETTHEWTSTKGHVAMAVMSIVIESIDHRDLKIITSEIARRLWHNSWYYVVDKIDFRGQEPPKFLPPFLDITERFNIYQSRLDFMVEYEFAWEKIAYPITNFVFDTDVGVIPGNTEMLLESLIVGPGKYLITGTIHGPPVAYQMSGLLIE